MKEHIEWLLRNYTERLEAAKQDQYSNPHAVVTQIDLYEEFIIDLQDLLKEL